MNGNTEMVPALLTPEAAKARAIAIIQSQKDAISFIHPEDLDTAGVFLPIVTVLRATENDFHRIAGGRLMPKGHHTDRIAEACGVHITRVSVQIIAKHKWSANAAGWKRLRDGSRLEREAEYEFDAESRAEEDFLRDPSKYPTENAKRLHVLELARFGHQRASTGAALALIRKLAAVPITFGPEEIRKAMCFARVDINTDALLRDPSIRMAAINQMIGASREVYGQTNGGMTTMALEAQPAVLPARTIDPDTGEIHETPTTGDLFEDDVPWQEEKSAPITEDQVAKLKDALRVYLQKAMPQQAVDQINNMLGDQEATVEQLNLLIDRCENYLQRRADKQRRTA